MSAPSTVLVFGSGQLGVFAARALAELGVHIRSADAAPDLAFFARYGPRTSSFTLDRVDITQRSDVDEFILPHGAQAVVLAAGLTGQRAMADPARAREVVERGAENVLSAACRAGIERAVAVSSLAVYSTPTTEARLTEDSPAEPRTLYGEILSCFENAVQRFAARMEIVTLRVAGAFGPNRFNFGSHSSRFVERMLYASALGDPVRVQGCWEDEDDIVYVKDIARVIAAAVAAPRLGSVTLNVGTGRSSSVREIADAVRSVFTESRFEIVAPPVPRQPLRQPPLDTTRLARVLGISPVFSLATAMDDYAKEAGLIDGL